MGNKYERLLKLEEKAATEPIELSAEQVAMIFTEVERLNRNILKLFLTILTVWAGVVYYNFFIKTNILSLDLFNWYDFIFLLMWILMIILFVKFSRKIVLSIMVLIFFAVGYRFLLDIIIFLGIMMVGVATGVKVLRNFKFNNINYFEEVIFGSALGLGLMSLVMMLFGLMRLYYASIIWSLLVLLFFYSYKEVINLINRTTALIKKLEISMWGFWEKALLSAIFCFVIFILIQVLAPEIQYDALMYHLAVPRIYIENHGIVMIPEEHRSFFPFNVQMLFLLGLLIKGETVAKLISFSFLILNLISIFSFINRFTSTKKHAILPTLLFLSTPVVGWLASTCYVDLSLSFYVLVSFYSFYLWFTNAENDNALYLSGVLFGISQGVKLFTAFYFATVFILGIFKKMYFWKKISSLFITFIIYCFVAIPWYLRSYILTGNPIYPLMNGFFQGTGWKISEATTRKYGVGFSFIDFLKIPWDMTLKSSSYDIPWGMGILWLVFAVIIIFGYFFVKSKGEKKIYIVLNILTITLSVIWFLTSQNFRYFTPILTFLALLLGIAINKALIKMDSLKMNINRNFVFLLIILCLVTNYVLLKQTFWNVEGHLPLKVVYGKESKFEYLKKSQPSFVVYDYINQTYGKNARVLSLNSDFLYFSKFNVIYPYKSPQHVNLFDLNEKEAIEQLKRLKITHILVDFRRHLPDNIYTSKFFYEKYLTIERVYDQKILYKLHFDGRPRTKQKELLSNTDFHINGRKHLPNWDVYGEPKIKFVEKNKPSSKVTILANERNGLRQTVKVNPSQIYILSHISKSESGIKKGRLQVNWSDSQGNFIGASIKVYLAAERYSFNDFIVQAPSNAHYATIYVSTNSIEDNIWFKKFSFMEIKYLPSSANKS